MNRVHALALGLLLALPSGCGARPAASTTLRTPEHETNDPSFDQQFVAMMIPHHQGAVDMAKIARERAEHAELQAMAERIVASQEGEIRTMQSWSQTDPSGGGAPGAMSMTDAPGMSSMARMPHDLAMLKTASPFDPAFLDAMIPHHQGAVEMGLAAEQEGRNPELVALAAKIVRDQREEIAQMREWREAWYPTPGLAGSR